MYDVVTIQKSVGNLILNPVALDQGYFMSPIDRLDMDDGPVQISLLTWAMVLVSDIRLRALFGRSGLPET